MMCIFLFWIIKLSFIFYFYKFQAHVLMFQNIVKIRTLEENVKKFSCIKSLSGYRRKSQKSAKKIRNCRYPWHLSLLCILIYTIAIVSHFIAECVIFFTNSCWLKLHSIIAINPRNPTPIWLPISHFLELTIFRNR